MVGGRAALAVGASAVNNTARPQASEAIFGAALRHVDGDCGAARLAELFADSGGKSQR